MFGIAILFNKISSRYFSSKLILSEFELHPLVSMDIILILQACTMKGRLHYTGIDLWW